MKKSLDKILSTTVSKLPKLFLFQFSHWIAVTRLAHDAALACAHEIHYHVALGAGGQLAGFFQRLGDVGDPNHRWCGKHRRMASICSLV